MQRKLEGLADVGVPTMGTTDEKLPHTLGDSLAHGLAQNILRELDIQVNHTYKSLPRYIAADLKKTCNPKRSIRLINTIDSRFSALSLWSYRSLEGFKSYPRFPGIALWDLPVASSRDGLNISRLCFVVRQRELPGYYFKSIMEVSPHVLARIFQRDMPHTKAEVLAILRNMQMYIGVVWRMAARLGHRQWGIPTGDGDLIIGAINNSEGDPDWVTWKVRATTYLKPLGPKWAQYLAALQTAIANIREDKDEGHLALDFAASDDWEGSEYAEMSYHLEQEFSKPIFEWLKDEHRPSEYEKFWHDRKAEN